jgi:PAS domain S-box-containing protein
LVHPNFDRRDHPLLAKQLERRVPFFYDDRLLEKGLWSGLARDPNDNRSGALLPLVANGRLLGGLSLASSRARTWSRAERTAMQLICDTLAAMFDRRRLEEARHRIEARFRTLADHSADIVVLCDSQGVLVYVSPASVPMLGTPPEELIGLPARNLFHPDDLPVVDHGYARLAAGEDATFEARISAADDRWVWAAVSSRVGQGSVEQRTSLAIILLRLANLRQLGLEQLKATALRIFRSEPMQALRPIALPAAPSSPSSRSNEAAGCLTPAATASRPIGA